MTTWQHRFWVMWCELCGWSVWFIYLDPFPLLSECSSSSIWSFFFLFFVLSLFFKLSLASQYCQKKGSGFQLSSYTSTAPTIILSVVLWLLYFPYSGGVVASSALVGCSDRNSRAIIFRFPMYFFASILGVLFINQLLHRLYRYITLTSFFNITIIF